MKKILAIVLSLTLALSLAACTGSGASSSAPAPSAAPSASAVRPVSTASANSEYYYPVTLEVYNNARELVPYTFEQCPERTLVYGKNNVEIMLALGLEDKILMTADCSSVLPEYEEAFAELDRVKNHQDVGYFVKEYALSLEPDMVIGWYSLFNIEDRMGDVGFWHERGIGTYTSINSVLKDDQSLQNVLFQRFPPPSILQVYAPAARTITAKAPEQLRKGRLFAARFLCVADFYFLTTRWLN